MGLRTATRLLTDAWGAGSSREARLGPVISGFLVVRLDRVAGSDQASALQTESGSRMPRADQQDRKKVPPVSPQSPKKLASDAPKPFVCNAMRLQAVRLLTEGL